MALTAKFYQFGKKNNSTKQPLLSNLSFTAYVELKDSCSIINPVLVLNLDGVPVSDYGVLSCNYLEIPEFGRFYFINDWVWSGGVWQCTCTSDPLATFKTAILQQTFYVMRSTYDNYGNVLYDGTVGDSKYPVTAAQPTYSSDADDNPFTEVDGVYIVGIINSYSENGAVTYYTFNAIGFRVFCSQLFNYSSGWLDIDTTEISEDLQKALVNPFQYVVSCQYLPINVQDVIDIGGTATTTIRFGWWNVTVPQGARIIDTTARVRRTNSLAITRHPLAATRGSYLNLSPYSIYTLRYYPFGTINIDSEAIAGWNTLDLYADLDLCTGKGILNICVNGFNNPIRTIEAQIGVPIPTASLQTSYSNIATGNTALMAAGATLIGGINTQAETVENPVSYNGGGFLDTLRGTWQRMKSDFKHMGEQVSGAVGSGGIKQMASDIFNLAVAASTTAEIQGMQGNASAYNAQTLTLSGRFLPIVSEDFDHIGRPLMALRQLGTLSGFVLCRDADVSFICTERERDAVKAFLEGGFFIE
jgi:hypothetical protein